MIAINVKQKIIQLQSNVFNSCTELFFKIHELKNQLLLRIVQLLKITTTILLFIIILLQTFAPYVYDAAYALNKKYIAQTFCINKEKPVMHCSGHCYLEKQKQKQENNDKQAGDTKQEKFSVTVYHLPESNTLNFHRSVTVYHYAAGIISFLPGYSSSIFHPPLV